MKAVVDGVDDDPGLPLGRELGRHVRTELVHGRREARVHVGLDGVDVGWEEDPGARSAHLVDVVDDLGMPIVLGPHGMLGLGLVEREPVPVVVVAHIELIQPRRCGAFELRAVVLVVELVHPLGPVGVQGRDLEEDHVVQDLLHLGVGRGRHGVGQAGCSLTPAHLGGVDVVGDHHDGPALVEEGLQVIGPVDGAGVGQPALDAVEFVQASMVVGAGDGQHYEGAALGGHPEGVHRHTVAGSGQGVIVAGELIPGGQPSRGPDVKAEMVLGTGHGLGAHGHLEEESQEDRQGGATESVGRNSHEGLTLRCVVSRKTGARRWPRVPGGASREMPTRDGSPPWPAGGPVATSRWVRR